MHPAAQDPMDPQNIGSLIDHMMDTALRMPMIMEPREPVFFMFIDDTQTDESSAPEEQALDSMVTRLMQQGNCDKHKQGHEEKGEGELPALHNHIRLKGEEILKQEDIPEGRRRLARRLTEISPEEFIARAAHNRHDGLGHHHGGPGHHHHHHDPPHMCPRKLQCLIQADEQKKLSPGCSQAVSHLVQVRTEEATHMEEMALYMSMFWFYCVLCICLFTLILCRKWKSNTRIFWLRLKVLQAVYSNPEIKCKVEEELDSAIGAVPPVGQVGLKMMSQKGREECREKRKRFYTVGALMLLVFTLDTFGYMPRCWPFVFMGLACMFIIVRMTTVCFSPAPVRGCSCCCCGGSTLDVENGTVTSDQACCSCCKGSGICAPKCQTCCGISEKAGAGGCCGGSCGCGNGSDCNGDCGCCGDDKNACSVKKRVAANMVVYEGVPIQIV